MSTACETETERLLVVDDDPKVSAFLQLVGQEQAIS